MIQLKSDGLISRKISEDDDLPRCFFHLIPETASCHCVFCLLDSSHILKTYFSEGVNSQSMII